MGPNDKEHICLACGHVGYPKKIANGSFAVEIIIWVLFILIAASSSYWILVAPLAYSASRTFIRKNICELCKGAQIIPADSPNGQALIASKNSTASE
jgi:hypothetical protein